jgi:regulator of sigma E protease
MDFLIYPTEKTFSTFMSYSATKAWLIVRMCWESIYDLIVGRYTVEAVSGPVGISEALGEAAGEDMLYLLYMAALISVNLGLMNLLPIPALDGGRIVALIVEIVTRKKLPKKIESTINSVGLALLLGLSFIILIKDVFGLFV